MFDPHKIQKDFPILKTKLKSGRSLVYLDSAATSQKPQVVIDAISHFYTHDNANVHRGLHELGDRATKAWHESRNTVASFFGATSQELVMTRNATEAINMVAYSIAEKHVTKGDLILATQMDHHSNLVPWQELARRKGAEIQLVPVTKEGLLDIDWLEKKLKTEKGKLKIMAFPHVSNTLGTINPVQKIIELLKQYQPRVVTVLDAAQSAPHLPVNFKGLGVDFMAISAHKMLGPMGVGGLFVRQALINDLEPWLFGGGMIGEVYDEHATFADDVEDRLTAGTPDVAGAVGWAAACSYLGHLGMNNVSAHDQEMVTHTMKELSKIKEIEVVGPQAEDRSGSVTFLYKKVHSHDVAQILSSEGLAVRSGHHCTMPLHKHMGWAATTRVSFNVYTTKQDIDAFISALEKIKKVFG